MAYDKIITIRARLDDCLRYVQDGEKTALSRALDYIENSNKTALDDEVILQSAINCTVENCYLDMQRTKLRFGKQGGVVGYHLVHSYAPGETTPEQAHEAGVEFARRLLGDKYEAVVCTHVNREHLHCHIVFNSVSFVDGTKYLPSSTEGGSVFEIPVSAFDEPVSVIGDTVAMSKPHEIEYTLTFRSDTLQSVE